MLAILAPLQEELRTLRTYLEADTTVFCRPSTLWHGRIGPHELTLGRTGIGAKAMQHAAHLALQHLRCTQLLCIGFAGTTVPHTHVGDLLVADPVIDAATGRTWTPATADRDKVVALCHEAGLPIHHGPLVTVPQVIHSPHEKAFLGTQHQAIGVDMESSAAVAVAADAGIPWCVIRAIVDPMEAPLPEAIVTVEEDGTVAIPQLLWRLLRHPRSIGALPRMHFAATKAREALTTFVKRWIAAT